MKFITDHPALLHNKVLVVSDLHIGIEHELYTSGIKVPSRTEDMAEDIKQLLEQTGAQKLILLGDVKHQVPGASWQERDEIPEFFRSLQKDISGRLEIEILPGNHDGNLSKLLPDIKIHSSKGFLLDNLYLSHGHTWPNKNFLKADYIVIGHNHPVLEFRDKLGYRWLEQVWLKAELDRKKTEEKYKDLPEKLPEVLVMPAFNSFLGGRSIDKEKKIMGPLGNVVETDQTRIYLLDGTLLGKLEEIIGKKSAD